MPVDGRVGFFSRGDCMLTRTSFFSGHEWLTHFGNKALADNERFTEAEIGHIIEGNRRVDFPKELLIHLNNSLAAYIVALGDYHAKRENQRFHFLLDDKSDTPEAARAALDAIRETTRQALSLWTSARIRALTLFGRACHILQDAYSEAHTVRRGVGSADPSCIVKVKAYMKRAAGHDLPDIEFHGGGEDATSGHTTSADSIYKEGRACHDPETESVVAECLSPHALAAVEATAAYLAVVHALARSNAKPDEVDAALDAYVETHLSLCDGSD